MKQLKPSRSEVTRGDVSSVKRGTVGVERRKIGFCKWEKKEGKGR